jgi:hypothetical protein
MKLYYNGKGFPCKWKTQMKNDNMWYSMEPVKIKFTLPESVYNAIMIDIKLDEENKILTINFSDYEDNSLEKESIEMLDKLKEMFQ